MMNIQEIEISKISPYKDNPRINEDAVEVVSKSLSEFGFQQPLVLDKDMSVVVGHTRLLAAKKLGLSSVPCLVADKLSEEQIKAYRIMDNKSAEFAQWNYGLLSKEIADLLESDYDLELTGFSEEELAALDLDLDTEFVEEGNTDEDQVPDLPSEPVTKLGDLWQLGNHRLLCGDSTDILNVESLLDGNKADLLFTDPPYNVAFNGRSGKFDVIKNDNLTDQEFSNFIDSFLSILKLLEINTYYICCNWAFYGILQTKLKPKACIVWAKNVFGLGKGYRHQHEFILFDGFIDSSITNESDLWKISRYVAYKHPTQKPVELSERAIKNSTRKNNIVLDLFGGSGSTLLACEKTERKSRLLELDPKYCDVIIQRWQDYTGKDAVHLETEKYRKWLIHLLNIKKLRQS